MRRPFFLAAVLTCCLAACASSNVNLQRESARFMTPVPLPDAVKVTDVQRSASSVKWVATGASGVYDCTSDDMLRRPLCVKRP
jgi:acyl dehydratase